MATSSKLKEAKTAFADKTRVTSSSTTITTEEKKNKEVPVGAKILRKTVRVETEKIENGWLISKNFDVKYTMGKDDKGNSDYAYYTKKYYSKEDPLEIKLTDASLADEFSAEDQ